MTHDEIIEMAKQVGVEATGNEYWPFFIEELMDFAKLVAEKAIKEALAQPEQIPPSADSNTHQPERHELQAKGEHPAPCARHCEANAFQIVIKNLKAQLAQPEQEPVAWPCLIDSADFSENTITLVMQCDDYKVSAGTHWLSTTQPKEKK